MTTEASARLLPCVILAGGLGTRMWPLTERLPKALVPVLGRPFIEWQLEWLRSLQVTDVLLSIGYRGAQVRDHVGDGRRFGLRIRYVDEGASLRGTGGALRLALDRRLLPDAFFVLYGDSYLKLDLADVERVWRESGLPALMTVFPNGDRWDQSNAAFEHGLVLRYDKGHRERHGPRMRWIDYGLSILTSDVVREGVPEGAADVADLFRTLAREGKLAGYEARHRFYEIGSPDGLAALEAHLRPRAGGSVGGSGV